MPYCLTASLPQSPRAIHACARLLGGAHTVRALPLVRRLGACAMLTLTPDPLRLTAPLSRVRPISGDV